MIDLTRLDKEPFAVNPDLIERIYTAPDTTLVLVDGSVLIVRETKTEVVDRIVDFRARVIAAARALPVITHTPGPISLVEPATADETTGGKTVPLRPRTN